MFCLSSSFRVAFRFRSRKVFLQRLAISIHSFNLLMRSVVVVDIGLVCVVVIIKAVLFLEEVFIGIGFSFGFRYADSDLFKLV